MRNYGPSKSQRISWHLGHDSHRGPLTVMENTKIKVFVSGWSVRGHRKTTRPATRVSWIRSKPGERTFSSPHQILGHTKMQECCTVPCTFLQSLPCQQSHFPLLSGTYQLSEPPAVRAADKLRSLSVNSRPVPVSLDHLTGQLQE
jgi:hypothetical protein